MIQLGKQAEEQNSLTIRTLDLRLIEWDRMDQMDQMVDVQAS